MDLNRLTEDVAMVVQLRDRLQAAGRVRAAAAITRSLDAFNTALRDALLTLFAAALETRPDPRTK